MLSIPKTGRFLAAAAVGALAALLVSLMIQQLITRRPAQSPALQLEPDDPAVRYVRALQVADYSAVITLTEWMQARLQAATAEARARVEAELIARLQARSPVENQLRLEGIEDTYLFAPGAIVEPITTDAGRTDLDQPVHHRTWFQVTYPDPKTAPLGPDNHPLHTLRAALNISQEGLVLKAGVIGNAEVDAGSLISAAGTTSPKME